MEIRVREENGFSEGEKGLAKEAGKVELCVCVCVCVCVLKGYER